MSKWFKIELRSFHLVYMPFKFSFGLCPIFIHLKCLLLETRDYTCVPSFFKKQWANSTQGKAFTGFCPMILTCFLLWGFPLSYLIVDFQVPDSWCYLFTTLVVGLNWGKWGLEMRCTKVLCNSQHQTIYTLTVKKNQTGTGSITRTSHT